MKRFIFIVAVIAAFASCQTPVPVIGKDMPPNLFFQKAQEEADLYHWDNALLYYTTFLDRFPDDLANGLAARYEIAFISYKKGNEAEALRLFRDLQARYKEVKDPFSVPQWPKVLADKLVKKLEDLEKPKGQAGPAPKTDQPATQAPSPPKS
jgi:hypothetical protein